MECASNLFFEYRLEICTVQNSTYMRFSFDWILKIYFTLFMLYSFKHDHWRHFFDIAVVCVIAQFFHICARSVKRTKDLKLRSSCIHDTLQNGTKFEEKPLTLTTLSASLWRQNGKSCVEFWVEKRTKTRFKKNLIERKTYKISILFEKNFEFI